MIECFKLVSGEEIISKVSDNTDTTIKLVQVRSLEMVDSEDGYVTTMLPFTLGNIDATITIEYKNVITKYKPSKLVEDAYTAEVLGDHISASFGV
jgi:hypothetical protein